MNRHLAQALFFFLLTSFISPAQTIVGSWKRIGNLLIMNDGSTKDMQKKLVKAMPCQAEMKYVFTAGGDQYSESPNNCGTGESMSHATYKLSGNKLTLVPKKDPGIPFIANYEIAFKANQMILSHEYTDAEKMALHSKAKRIIITYQKV